LYLIFKHVGVAIVTFEKRLASQEGLCSIKCGANMSEQTPDQRNSQPTSTKGLTVCAATDT